MRAIFRTAWALKNPVWMLCAALIVGTVWLMLLPLYAGVFTVRTVARYRAAHPAA